MRDCTSTPSLDPEAGTLVEPLCDACGSSANTKVMKARDIRYGTPGWFQLVRCDDCGLVFVSPRPAAIDLAKYYPSNYAPHDQAKKQHASSLGSFFRTAALRHPSSEGVGLRVRAYNALAFRAFVARDRPGKVLDVGCGPGDYLRIWRALGWSIEGVEPDPAVARRAVDALHCPIHVATAETADLPADTFDLVTMSHSLEHTLSPTKALTNLASAVKRGGRLLVMVPNFRSWDSRLFGACWFGLEVPRHLYHFDPRTLSNLLSKTGFMVEAIGGSAHPDVVVRSIAYALGSRLAHDTTLHSVWRAVGVLVNLPAAVVVRSTSLWCLAQRCS